MPSLTRCHKRSGYESSDPTVRTGSPSQRTISDPGCGCNTNQPMETMSSRKQRPVEMAPRCTGKSGSAACPGVAVHSRSTHKVREGTATATHLPASCLALLPTFFRTDVRIIYVAPIGVSMTRMSSKSVGKKKKKSATRYTEGHAPYRDERTSDRLTDSKNACSRDVPTEATYYRYDRYISPAQVYQVVHKI